jgi:hypothetical protein
MKFESWVAFGALALGVMFVALLVSFYNFLVGTGVHGPQVAVDPQGVLVMIVSISGAPSLILAGAVGGLSRSKPTRFSGFLLIITAIIVLAGMMQAIILLSKINTSFVVPGMDIVPIIFAAAAVGVGAFGGYLIIASKRSRQSFEGAGFESDIL